MSAHWAAPGVKCVCLNSRWAKGPSLTWREWVVGLMLGWPVAGGVYQVTDVAQYRGATYIALKGWGVVLFPAWYFRPLVSRSQEQDVALFAPLLDPNSPTIPETTPRTPANAGGPNHGE